ncbi:MAG: T9SS type A sorting domain-containing protein, partial [Bacteroidota bacterium]
RAFKWTASSGMQDLGTPAGVDNSEAYDVTNDGSVIVGWSQGRAVLWTSLGGWQLLDSICSRQLTDGSFLQSARAVSPDGRYIVGAGTHYVGDGRGEAFLLDTRSPTSVEQGLNAEKLNYRLNQNCPNPFNPTTTIGFSLPKHSHVTLKVFDVLGREVASLVDGELNAGEHSVVFNAGGLSSGVYFYRLSSSRGTYVKSALLLK